MGLGCFLFLWNVFQKILKLHHGGVGEIYEEYMPPRVRPSLFIHIGPPKTATTTIQWALRNWSLTEDNIIFYDDHTRLARLVYNNSCHREMSNARIANRSVASVTCAQQLSHLFQKTRRRNQGSPKVVISHEALSLPHKTKVDWIALQELLNDWDISVLVMYRRYFEWLPSSRQQTDRWTPMKPRLGRWPSQGGRVMKPLLPIPQGSGYSFVDEVIQQVEGLIPYKLLNMHAGALQTFFCEGLRAPIACKTSREERRTVTKNPSSTIFYDALVTAAESLVDSRLHRRRKVTLMAQYYWEQELAKTWRDLPVKCPPTGEYKLLLEESLAYERQLWPDHYRTIRQNHIRDFEQAVKSHKFCIVDSETALQDPRWKIFFQRFIKDNDMVDSSTGNGVEQYFIRQRVHEFLDDPRMPPNTPGAVIHIGKTGGSSVTSQLRNGCHSFVPKPCSIPVNETLISRTTTYFHTPDLPSLTSRYHFYVLVVRDPLDRTLSAFYYQHPANQLVKSGNEYRRHKRIYQCFPTLDDLGNALAEFGEENLGSNKPQGYYPFSKDVTDSSNCSRLAVALFDNKVRDGNHFYFDMKYAARRANLFHDSTVLAVRNENLWSDWKSANEWLGNSNVSEVTSVRLRDYTGYHLKVNKDATDETKRLLCLALQDEYVAYLSILIQSVNLSPYEKQQSLLRARSNCPALKLEFTLSS